MNDEHKPMKLQDRESPTGCDNQEQEDITPPNMR